VVINKKRLTAPFAASTGIHQFEVGQLIQGDTQITTLVGLTKTLWVDFELPQRARDVAVGGQVHILREGQGSIAATVIAKASELSDKTRSLKYRAEFTSAQSGLIPQSFVALDVPAGQVRSLAEIPDTSLRVDQLGDFVYLLKADATDKENPESGQKLRAHRQAVVVQSRKLNKVVIATGLNQGDLIAAKGAFKLREQLLVNIAPSAEAGVKQ
jgi:membrane fusion protein (multidrug efflux system)